METVTLAPAMRLLDWFGGEPIRWYRHVGPCPCSNPQTGTYDRTHALCGGSGRLKEEVDVSRFQAIISNATAGKSYTGIGELIAGDLMCATWPDEIPLAHFDEVVVPSRTRQETAVLTRGAGVDALPMAFAVEILRVYGMGGPITAGYHLSAAGIAWTGGPAPGDRYTVLYRYEPRWEVLGDSTLIRRPDPGGQRLPQKVGLRLITPPR